ncbi:MAG: U32 family peptidase [Verrucomicrobiales bacterium]|nr:U32 family peptidase [Verrucomicrobiales bacterium]
MTHQHPEPELLAPAGNFDCARAAVANGANAIYFGLSAFNARMRADNFTVEDLPELMEFLHSHGVKGYVTFNTLIFTGELESAATQLKALYEAGVDAIIVQDMGLARMARAMVPGLGLHGSTQMTITSPEGLALVDEAFHLNKAVIARENSLKEIHLFQAGGNNAVPLETFVHGALCVAYSGQCLTSESLGQRSANRGECAQACRMTYELYVDGEHRDLGDKRYLLSPQDLAGVDLIPQLIDLGVNSFKVEGRLKTPEYVAAVTNVYRKAIDAALGKRDDAVDAEDRYQLEMTFSRGLHSGWLDGINNKKLVHARFGKKRGAYVGKITDTGKDWVAVKNPNVPLKKGDGLVIDTGGDTDKEQGGRIYEIRDQRILFQRGKLDTRKVQKGDRLWKTDDPALTKKLQQSWKGNFDHLKQKHPLRWSAQGQVGNALKITDLDSGNSQSSTIPLEKAQNRPLTAEFLYDKLNRLGNTDFVLASLDTTDLGEDVILPVSEINRLRRELVQSLATGGPAARPAASDVTVQSLQPVVTASATVAHSLRVLCRTEEQISAACEAGVGQIYIDLEDVRRYKSVVPRIRETAPEARIFLATPRIQKAGETGLFRIVEKARPDGVLVRNLGGVKWFNEHSELAMVGDFSLNVANPVSADFFMNYGFENLTVSYDLNIQQVLDLLAKVPSHWFELTVHQHMPMFHMEHCVFCSFMSDGTDFTNCGRPCDHHEVQLKDRVGQKHILKADVGCRNTLFNGRAQTGARYFETLHRAGLQAWRVELLNENRQEALEVIEGYRDLIDGKRDGQDLWQQLKAESKLGVVEGTLDEVKV